MNASTNPAPETNDVLGTQDQAPLTTESQPSVERPAREDSTSGNDLRQAVLELRSLIESMSDRVVQGFTDVLSKFDDKIAYDTQKEEHFNKLYSEYRECRHDELTKTSLPWINGLIRMHDNLGKTSEGICAKGCESLGIEEIARVLKDFQDEIEILMENNGIETYRDLSETFNAKRQQVVSIVDTYDEPCDGRIAARVRSGFERDGRILRKEKVKVYKLAPSVDMEPQPTPQRETETPTAVPTRA